MMNEDREKAGYTLVELLVVMLIFAVVMSLISVSFARIVRSSGQLMKSAETDTGGLIGLELMRTDLELAGFGLHWSAPGIMYSEAHDNLSLVQNCQDGCPQAKASLFDDRAYDSDKNIPRAYGVGNNVGYNGSDYLVLKGSALGTSRVSRTWGYLNYSTAITVQYPEGDDDLRFKKGDRAIVIKTGTVDGVPVRKLVTDGYTFTINRYVPFPDKFLPRDKGDSYLVYGVATEDSSALGFPFNRADYYISRPVPDKISSSCVPGTGVLYKTNITQGGGFDNCPILDCAADLQVVLYWDTNEDGEIDYRSSTGKELLPSDLRDKLKEIRVYILAQQGKRDPGYRFPLASADAAIIVGDAGLSEAHGEILGRVWSASAMEAAFGANWRNYHWKLYTIVVQPKNL